MKKRKRSKLFIIISALLVCVAAAAWWAVSDNGNAGQRSARETARVTRRDFSSTVLATGAVKPQVGAEVRVGARISGKVEHLYANIGDHVKKGQVIAELEKADLEAAVAKARAEVKVAEARVAGAGSGVKLANLEYQRQQNLIKKDFTSRQAVDKALKEKESARAGLDLAGKQLDAARAALEEARVKLSYATITASISGVIGSVSTQQGETVSAGLNAPTFVTIIDLDRLQVDAYVDEVDIGKIKIGQKCIFTVDAFPAREFHGKVVAIYPEAVIQENVVNYDVVVEIADPYDGLLRPEMTASVTILLRKRKQVLAVPAKAVKRERGRNIVYLPAKDGPEIRRVNIGWKDGQWIEITAGLKEGENVLLEKPGINHKGNNNRRK
ncbi:MAG: efflux RND transporter periplasmic adaptor subunit [Deltaproteobacteria bacterium]|nr:efflux RND transporter periplasmic adaptor subunit [Deltaproteobacteria bacterium]